MKQLFSVVSFFCALARQKYTGRVEVSWKEGVPQHTRTESSRVPEELPGDDAAAVELLASARGEQT